jgi:hypothetical protein
MDRYSGKALCVIDLDTVMPGLAAYDFGDSIRFGAASAAEDEEDLSRMRLELGLFETYTRGYLKACDNLTRLELETLPLGAFTMTLECGVRFLTDYLEGDRYFKIRRPDHNLLRCRTQFTSRRTCGGRCRSSAASFPNMRAGGNPETAGRACPPEKPACRA